MSLIQIVKQFSQMNGQSQSRRSTGTIFLHIYLPVALNIVAPVYPSGPIFTNVSDFFLTGPVTCRNVLRISKYTTKEILHHAVINVRLSTSSCQSNHQRYRKYIIRVQFYLQREFCPRELRSIIFCSLYIHTNVSTYFVGQRYPL